MMPANTSLTVGLLRRRPCQHLPPAPWPASPSNQPHFSTSAPALLGRLKPLGKKAAHAHPGTPSFRLSPTEHPSLATSRKAALGYAPTFDPASEHASSPRRHRKSWHVNHEQNILRRKDGITGKWVHMRQLPLFHAQHEKELRAEAARERRDLSLAQATELSQRAESEGQEPEHHTHGEAAFERRLREWKFPTKTWNPAAPRAFDTYSQHLPPVYTVKQREALATIRRHALMYEVKKEREERIALMTPAEKEESVYEGDTGQGGVVPDTRYEEAGLRNPLYAFFRGGQALQPGWWYQSKNRPSPWSMDQLRRKSFEDLHTLWYLVLKERNLILTHNHELKRTLGKKVGQFASGLLSGADARRATCNITLKNIKAVLVERRSALQSQQSTLLPAGSALDRQFIPARALLASRRALASLARYASPSIGENAALDGAWESGPLLKNQAGLTPPPPEGEPERPESAAERRKQWFGALYARALAEAKAYYRRPAAVEEIMALVSEREPDSEVVQRNRANLLMKRSGRSASPSSAKPQGS